MNDGGSSSPPLPDARHRREAAWRLWRAPGIAWLALLALFAANLCFAYLPLGVGNVTLSLLIAAMMIAVLVTFLMDLQHSQILTRIVACAGVFWTILMFALIFCDYLSRHY